MQQAIRHALTPQERGDTAVGSVVVCNRRLG